MSLGFQIDIKGAIDIVKEHSEINCNNQINTLRFSSRHNYAGDFLSLHAHVADNNFHIWQAKCLSVTMQWVFYTGHNIYVHC